MASFLDQARRDLIDSGFKRQEFTDQVFTTSPLVNAKGYRVQSGSEASEAAPLLMDPALRSTSGSDALGARPLKNAALSGRFAGDALLGLTQTEEARRQAEAQREAAAAKNRGSTTGAILQGIGTIASAAIFCDERLKCDIAPLESVHAGDELSDLAWAVKEIRERS